MSTDTQSAPQLSAPQPGPVRVERRLPRFAPLGLFVLGIALGAALSAATGFSVTSTVIYGVVLGTLLVYVATRAVEGRRKATDRLVTCLVTTAFGIAMIPLVSLVYTVLDKGLARFDGDFFNNSMFRVVGEGGGAYHAILGTLIITLVATVISVPIGLFTAIYLVEYGTGRLKKALSKRASPLSSTVQTSDTSGTMAMPKAVVTRQVTSRSVALRRPSTARVAA